MKLVSYVGGFGRIVGDSVVHMGADLLAYLSGQPAVNGEVTALSDLHLLAPVQRPEKVICVGLNYIDHAAETSLTVPDEPIIFAKHANSIIGPGAAIVMPSVAATRTDYEAELAVVIGRRAARVSAEHALGYVAGYCCANDVTARNLQAKHGQWYRGKAIDTYLPLGPFLVTPDEVGDPQALDITCSVDGVVLQEANTKDMLFSVADLIAFISQTITLQPGDVICTGTPPGVGFARKPARYLQPGNVVTVAIQNIGELTNPVAVEA